MRRCTARPPATGSALADTELFIEVERDLTVYGEEVKFGGGKVIRDGMGQSQASRADGAVDTVITNALIVDHSGIVQGRCRPARRAHRRHRQGRQPGHATRRRQSSSGPRTEIIAGEGQASSQLAVLTAHIHFICPQQIEEALHVRSDHHAGRRHGARSWGRNGHHLYTGRPGIIGRMLQAADAFPMNMGFCGQGQRLSAGRALEEQMHRWRLCDEAARGLGHHAGRHRLLPQRRRRASTCRS